MSISTQNILNSAKKIYNTPMTPNTHHGLGIGGAAVTTAIAYKLILKNIIEASSLSPVAQKRVKVILPTGMFATGVAVHLLAGKVASQLTLVAIAITSLIIGKVLHRRRVAAQAQLAKAAAAAVAKKQERKPNEAFVDAKDPSVQPVGNKKNKFEQEIVKKATKSEAEKKEEEKKALFKSNGRDPSPPKNPPASTTASSSSTSTVVRTPSAPRTNTTNTKPTDVPTTVIKTLESAMDKTNTIGSKLVTPPPTPSTTTEPKVTNGKTTPQKTHPLEKTYAAAVAPAAVKTADATRYIFTIYYIITKQEAPEAIDENEKYLQKLMKGLEDGSDADRLKCRNEAADLIINKINNNLEIVVSPSKGKKKITLEGWVLAGNIISHLDPKNAVELRKVIIGKQPDFFNIERLFGILEKENFKYVTLVGVLLSLKAEDQALLQQKLYSSTLKIHEPSLTKKLLDIPVKELREFAMPLDATEEQVKEFLNNYPKVSRLSLTAAQYEVAYKSVIEKGDKNLKSLYIDKNLTMTQKHLDLVANSRLLQGFKNGFQEYHAERVGNKSVEKKEDEKKEKTVKS